jgi:hypothetical protein
MASTARLPTESQSVFVISSPIVDMERPTAFGNIIVVSGNTDCADLFFPFVGDAIS